VISVTFLGLLLGVCGLTFSQFTGAGDRLIGVTDLCDKPLGVRLNREVVSLCYFWFCTMAVDPFHHCSAAFCFARNSVT
jgi:hypothetical protein